MRIGELFAGVGGLGRGVRDAIGGDVAWVSEVAPAARAVLDARLGVPNLGDITTIDWSTVQRPDVLIGGFPCQDVSTAGLRRGIAPGTRSGLWAHFAAAIDRLRPDLVVVENVRGLLSAHAHTDRDVEPCPGCLGGGGGGPRLRALGAVLGDLADLGFDAEWACVTAASVGAPHRRERVFLIAWPADADPGRLGRPRDRRARHGGGGPADDRGDAPDTHEGGRGTNVIDLRQWATNAHGRTAPDVGRRPRAQGDPDRATAGRGSGAAAWGPYAPAVTRWERVTGRPAPDPTVVSERAATGRALSPRAVEWLMGLPDGWVTDVPGVGRAAALQCLGNAVVPQQAAAAVRMLLDRADLAVAS